MIIFENHPKAIFSGQISNAIRDDSVDSLLIPEELSKHQNISFLAIQRNMF